MIRRGLDALNHQEIIIIAPYVLCYIRYLCYREIINVQRNYKSTGRKQNSPWGVKPASDVGAAFFVYFLASASIMRTHAMESARTVVPRGKIIRAKVTQIDLSRVVH